MGYQDRDYYRESSSWSGGSWGLDSLTPAVKWLLIINVVVFVLQVVIVREVHVSTLDTMRQMYPNLDKLLAEKEAEGPEAYEAFKKEHPEYFKDLSEDELTRAFSPTPKESVLQKWLELDIKNTVYGGQVWRLLTYAFCHDRHAVWHIFFNMLFLYWFGGRIESMYGSREFALFYLTAAVVSGLAFVGLNLYAGSMLPCVGASGAVLAVVMLYTMHFPREIIYVCWIIPVQMRFVMLVYLIVDLHPVLLALAGDQYMDGTAHAAHLGGVAFAFLYARYEWRLADLGHGLGWLRWKWKRRRLRVYAGPATLSIREPAVAMERVDEILQKICASGQTSLTEEERDLLRNASERLKKRSNDKE